MSVRLTGFFAKKRWAVTKQSSSNGVKIDNIKSDLSNTNTLTISHYLSAGTDRAVILVFSVEGGSPSIPTYNGVNMTFINGAGFFPSQLWLCVIFDADLPQAAGNYDVVMTAPPGSSIGGTVISCYNIEQSLPDNNSQRSQVISSSVAPPFSMVAPIDVEQPGALLVSAINTGNQTPDFAVYPPVGYSGIVNITPSSQRFASVFRLNAPVGDINITWEMPSNPNRVAMTLASFNPIVRGSHVLNGNIWEYRPAGFDSAPPNSYPVLIFFHGINAQGGTANNLLTADAPTVTSEIHNNNFNEEFIVLSPYLSFAPWVPDLINSRVQYVLSNAAEFKIDTSKIYLSGINMGASAISSYISNPAYTTPIAGTFTFPGYNPSTWGPAYQDYSANGMYHTILGG